jgi:hypothetical protein
MLPAESARALDTVETVSLGEMRMAMMRSTRPGFCSTAFLLTVLIGAHLHGRQFSAAPDQQFAILEIVKVATLSEELNEAAKQGFRLKMSAVEGMRVTAFMERTATPPNVYAYRIVSTMSKKAGDKEMNAAGADGFRVVPHTFMVKKGITVFNIDNVVVMEKEPNANKTYEYKVIAAARTSTFERELKSAMTEGWQVFDMVYGQILLERSKG